MDSATLILLGIYHGQANPTRISMDDIDKLEQMEKKFTKRYGEKDWEESEMDWADTVATWYNDNLDRNWNPIPMSETDPYFQVKKKMGQYLSNDEEDYDGIIVSLKKALKNKKKSLGYVDYLDGVNIWEKVENTFSVHEFCELIGLIDHSNPIDQALSEYVSNEKDEYPLIVTVLKKQLRTNPKDLVEHIQLSTGNYIELRGGVKQSYNVKGFCKQIGITLK